MKVLRRQIDLTIGLLILARNWKTDPLIRIDYCLVYISQTSNDKWNTDVSVQEVDTRIDPFMHAVFLSGLFTSVIRRSYQKRTIAAKWNSTSY